MKDLTVALDAIQAEDLRGYTKGATVLHRGMTIEVQLALAVPKANSETISPVRRLVESHAVNCNLREFFSQPLTRSVLTHVAGHVLDSHIAEYGPGKDPAFPKGSTNIEVLVSADGIEFLVPVFLEGHVDVDMPGKGEVLHLCGIMECLPSFSTYRLCHTVKGRVLDVWKCPRDNPGKWSIWGILRLQLDKRIGKADVSVSCVHGGDR